MTPDEKEKKAQELQKAIAFVVLTMFLTLAAVLFWR